MIPAQLRRLLTGRTLDAELAMAARPCSELRCPEVAGFDGCFHDPDEPFCAYHLRECSECRVYIDHDMPAGGAA